MNELETILNKVHQRAGLLAIMSGVLQTSSCDATKKTIAHTLKHIFADHSVDDDIEKITKRDIEMVLDKKEEQEDKMKEMIAMMREVLKD